MSEITVQIAGKEHFHLAEAICLEMEASAKVRGTGIAKRDPNYIRKKMEEGKAVIAITDDGKFAGFCYIETWGHGKYVSNSGLIVSPDFRKHGLATKIKEKAFELTRTKYPDAKLFGLTTSAAVMKINHELGYRAVTFPELTDDEDFWKGCQGCINYEILMSKDRKMCFCTGMLYDPEEKKSHETPKVVNSKVWENWLNFKNNWLMKWFKKEENKKTAIKQ